MNERSIVAACAALCLGSGLSLAQGTPPAGAKPQTIQVSGIGIVPVKPDMAIINLGVASEEADVQKAFTANNAATAKILAELEAAAVDSKDIQTSNFSIYPQTRAGENKQPTTVYHVSNTVRVKIRSLEKLPEILGKVVAAGSNSVSGLTLTVSNPENYLAEARKKAVADAQVRAETLADAAGVLLGPIVSMVEQGSSGHPIRIGGGAAYAGIAPVPVEPGEASVQTSIVAVFEIKPRKADGDTKAK